MKKYIHVKIFILWTFVISTLANEWVKIWFPSPNAAHMRSLFTMGRANKHVELMTTHQLFQDYNHTQVHKMKLGDKPATETVVCPFIMLEFSTCYNWVPSTSHCQNCLYGRLVGARDLRPLWSPPVSLNLVHVLIFFRNF